MATVAVGLCGPFAPASAHVPEECAWEVLAVSAAAQEMERHNNAITMAAEENMGALFAGFPLYMQAVNDLAAAVADFTKCVGDR